jgi:EpsD family peptidyl-prolyl cis-trans isomerase
MMVSGCHKASDSKSSQVAARVNGDEITIHQINFDLSQLGNVDAAHADQARAQVLKALVDQQLLVGQAVEERLDRDPAVLQALDADRRRVLASAYVNRLTQGVEQPSDAMIKEFYEKNPALFSQRRIYKFTELQVPTTPQNAAAIQAKLVENKNLDQFAAWLKAQNIPYQVAQSVKAAEQLPLDLLPRLAPLREGQALTVRGNGRFTVLLLVASQSQPVAETDAKASIQRYLIANAKRELAENKLNKLRADARIEYMGHFAELAARAPAPATGSLAQPAPPANVPPRASSRQDQEAIDRGVQGLK